MSTTSRVDFGGLHVRGAWNSALDESQPVRAELAFYTASGQARIAELDEREVIRLAAQCAEALEQLRIRRGHVERKRAERDVVSTPQLDDSPRALLDETGQATCARTGCRLRAGHIGGHAG